MTQGLHSLIFSRINLIVHNQRFSLRVHSALSVENLFASALFQKQPGVAEMKAFARGVPSTRCPWKCLYVGPLFVLCVLSFTAFRNFRAVSAHLCCFFSLLHLYLH